jgi:3',5'-cyclic AMP phosphodiesterase CpdA
MNTTTDASPTSAVRLAHFSDIHVTVPRPGWRLADWLSKRSTGWMNLYWLGRARGFREADRIVTTLVVELRQRRLDRVVFSGDATALGFEAEVAHAAELLGVAGPDALSGLAVPGNHDYYTRAAARGGFFERYFAPWQTGVRVDDATYPFAQRVGPLWLIGVNSCTGNRWPSDASGSVGPAQRARLAALLEQLEPGPRILVTHYPVCRSGGELERRNHGLRDLDAVVEVACRGGVCLWLHGHRHGAYKLDCPRQAPFPVICAGTATEHGRWSYGEYTIIGRQLHAVRRVYAAEGTFQDAETFDVLLRQPSS